MFTRRFEFQKLTLIALFAVLFPIIHGHPCDNDGHRRIPNLGLRYVNFRITGNDVPFHDSLLPPFWYYVGNDKMPSLPPPSIFTCGTKFPLWLNGDFPIDDIPVNRTACEKGVFEDCEDTTDIQIIKCTEDGGQYYLYYLTPTSTTESGYCFGVGEEGEVPDYTIPKPVTTVERYEYFLPNQIPISEALFKCVFDASQTDADIFYQVTWHRNGDMWHPTDYAKGNTDPRFLLTEELFVERGFQMGDNISCSVRPFVVEQGPPGQQSPLSEAIFVGIKVLTEELIISRGETNEAERTIRVQPTVPIGCVGVSSCDIWLTATVPSALYQCVGLSFERSNCGAKIESDNYEAVIEIPINIEETGEYAKHETYEVYLSTGNTKENRIWNNYALDPIKVIVTSPDAVLLHQSKRCRSFNDPHMKSFDDSRFDNHQAGTYILYKSLSYDTEVQILYYKCGSRPIMCNCGLAVRAGRDAYVFNVCNGKRELKRISCEDGQGFQLKTHSTYKYQVYFNYGTYVDISISVNTMTVEIIPSSKDVKNTNGLCGYLDDKCSNDISTHPEDDGIVHPCGTPGVYWNEPRDFINHWRVTDNSKNLFSNAFNFNGIPSYTFKVCVCENSTVSDSGGSGNVVNEIPCNTNGVASCKKGKPIGIHSCDSSESDVRRRRRSVHRNPTIPVVYSKQTELFTNKHQIVRRETVNWTEATATQFCDDFMKRSPVYSLCGEVPNADPYESVETCAMDIMLTGVTAWASMTIEDMQDTCLSELSRNTTLREAEVGQKSIAEAIEEVACINNCSSVGQCVNGECVCNEGLGGSDCSIDLSRGPTIAGLLDNGLCDEQEIECDYAYVFGEVFSDTANLTCRLEEFSISEKGKKHSLSTHYVLAEFETFVEVMCPLTDTRKKRSISGEPTDSFVQGYTISISNDDVVYEEGKDLFIFNSECQLQEVIGDEIIFTLKDNYCFINDVCVAEDLVAVHDECLLCDTTMATREWTKNIEIAECLPVVSKVTDPEKDSLLWVIGVVAGVFVIGAVIGVVIVKTFVMKRSKKVSDSALFTTPTPQRDG